MILLYTHKLAALRGLMRKEKLNGWIVPRQDEFQGEYVAPYAERLRWLTGFSGSWGTAVILQIKAAIFVDGRYTTQVKKQVTGKDYQFHHLVKSPPAEWIKANVKRGHRLGYDPMLLTISDAARYREACEAVGATLVSQKNNLIDQVWADQPKRSSLPLFVQPDRFAGRSAKAKLADMAKAMTAQGSDHAVLAEPSSVAWVFNLRGRDVAFTPVVLAFAILHSKGKAEIFVTNDAVPAEVRKALLGLAVVRNPADLAKSLKKLSNKRVLVDANSTPDFIYQTLKSAKAEVSMGRDPCTLPKAQKNSVEQQGARDAQRRDGLALSNFLHWFSVEAPHGELTEGHAAAKLFAFRKDTGLLQDLSFETIPAAGPNAAIPHYHKPNAQGRAIKLNEIFLIDSGGQYRDGTTDVTRTMIVREASAEMKDRFTRVLKGMIALSRLHFPEGTTGGHIDALARANLWAAGLDFDHGTGHGVGSYLSVHEGPARISAASQVALRPGMILSNEPGYYKPGHYGIRIENLLLVKALAAVGGGDRKMMSFETLTLAPIDRQLIDTSLLTPEELQWLDAYHLRVQEEVGSQMTGAAKIWMQQACSSLG